VSGCWLTWDYFGYSPVYGTPRQIDSTKTVRVWSGWLTKGPLIMVGERTSPNEIHVDVKEQGRGARLILRRNSPAR
jgi:hypothetical protein